MKVTAEMCSRMQYCTITQASEFYNTDKRNIYAKIKDGSIPNIRIGGDYRVAIWQDEYEIFLKLKEEKANIIAENAAKEQQEYDR